MKIVCEACQAKYSIADDKVKGKVFKIRCKKCSHIIVVRGNEQGAPVAAAASGSIESAEAVWHIVVEGEQVGPLSEGDVRARLSRGEVNPDSFIWREGFADWVKISTLPDFAALDDAGAAIEGGGDMFGQQPATSIYPPGTAENAFAAAVAPVAAAAPFEAAPDPFAASAPAPASLFAAAPAAVIAREPAAASPSINPFAAFDAPAPEPVRASANGGAAAAAGLTAQRHENSVLFSLSNLEALAKPSAPVASLGNPRSASAPPSEGSGLIDIKAMAASTIGSGGVGSGASLGDLPTFAPPPQFAPVAPVLLPVSSAGGAPKWLVGALIGVGVVVIGLVVLTINVIKSPAPPAPPVAADPSPAPTAPVAAAPPAAAPAVPTPPPITPPPAADEALPPRAEAPAATASASDRGSSRSTKRDSKGRDKAKTEPRTAPVAAAPTPAPARDEEPPKPKASKGSLDDLLEGALGGRKQAAAPAPKREEEPAAKKGGGDSEEPLSREDLVKGMSAIMPKASKACYDQFKVPGMADAYLTIGKNGRVTDVKVRGKFAGTPTGSCVEAAVKQARFPPNAGQNTGYPIFVKP